MKNSILSITLLICTALYSCKKSDDNNPYKTSGAEVSMGGGNARTIIETNDSNGIKSLTISIDKIALEYMPVEDHHTGHEHAYSYLLTLPTKKSLTPYDHVVVNWNPAGHPPAQIYDRPHFDFHFYSMTQAERELIPEYATDSSGFIAYPMPGYMPANYVPIPGGEAKMGTHWVDLTSPELAPTGAQPFTQTIIYGSYKGQVAFMEPMITMDFLKHSNGFTREIPQPQRFAKEGYYPTQMSILDKGATVEIKLHGFVYRTKS